MSNKDFCHNGVPPLPEPAMALLLPLLLPPVAPAAVGSNTVIDMLFVLVLRIFFLIFIVL